MVGASAKPELVWFAGIKHAQMRRLMSEVEARRDEFLAEWERIHGKAD